MKERLRNQELETLLVEVEVPNQGQPGKGVPINIDLGNLGGAIGGLGQVSERVGKGEERRERGEGGGGGGGVL